MQGSRDDRAASAGPAAAGSLKRILFVDDELFMLDSLRDALRKHRRVKRQLPLHVIEHETQGTTHAATGAYLLCLWGLPDGVVEAVAHHHNPLAAPGAMLDAVAAVHIAEALAHEAQQNPDGLGPPPLLDETYIEQLGVRRQLDQWRKLAQQAANACS